MSEEPTHWYGEWKKEVERWKNIKILITLDLSFCAYEEYHFVSLTLPCRFIRTMKWICKGERKLNLYTKQLPKSIIQTIVTRVHDDHSWEPTLTLILRT